MNVLVCGQSTIIILIFEEGLLYVQEIYLFIFGDIE